MGAIRNEDELAIEKSREIPCECRNYISHHVRNGLVSIMGAAMKLKDEPDAMKDLEEYVSHIARDLEKVGI